MGLNWVMESEPTTDTISLELIDSPRETSSATLSSEQARKLYDLGMMGDIAGILAEIEHLQHFPS